MNASDKTEICIENEKSVSQNTDKTEIIDNAIDEDKTLVEDAETGEILNENRREVYHLSIGTVVKGRYTIGDVLGFGGFGVVYKANDETLGRTIAVKEYFPTMFLSRDEKSNEAIVFDKKNLEYFERGKEAFLQEARNIAQYNTHPNIVHIYDYFEENGTAYFVMEYLDGCSLREYINQEAKNDKKIPVERAVKITQDVLEALKATHADGIIHRDIKPNNVYVLKDGSVKLFDFGAARFSNAELEKTRTVIITPGYAPPEQYQVKSKQGDFTDIYAVGAMLYEMLTGIRPEESINRKVSDTLVPPHSIDKRIPKQISDSVMRSMALQPEIRFSNVSTFSKSLESGWGVRSAKAEIIRRRVRRDFLVIIILAVVTCAGIYAAYRVFSSYRDVVLEDTSISIWVPEINDDMTGTKELFQDMASEYIQNNPQIILDFNVIDDDSYGEMLSAALANESGPDLYYIPDDMDLKSYSAEINDLYTDSNFDFNNYYFLENYKGYFSEMKFIPLLCDLPVVYENESSSGLADSDDYSDFLNNKTNFAGMVSDFTTIQHDMAGNYKIRESLDEERGGVFLYCFGVNNHSSNAEKAACIRLINYFLSDNAQELLAVEWDEGIPFNKSVWDVYMDINIDFAFFSNDIDFIFFGGK